MQLFVGRNAHEGDIARYAARFNLLELRADATNLPRGARLSDWKKRVPADFAFSVVLPKTLGLLESSEPELGRALEIAEALSAKWLLLQTPSSVGPSARMRERLSKVFAACAHAERRIAWESRGVWEDSQIEQFSAEHGVHVVRDVSRSEVPVGACVYTRLLALGDGVQIRANVASHVAEVLADREEAFVVIEGHGAEHAAKLLRQELVP
ncbi:MAG TPA: DUF72 domain-containing protein [Polyangiaceae bacterium]|jgi:uncharacterized protein YecE (DUF72 family)|nr:DUF72 domain-containing protein [Polyangiaceae bacterium]